MVSTNHVLLAEKMLAVEGICSAVGGFVSNNLAGWHRPLCPHPHPDNPMIDLYGTANTATL